jgi:hypothetical protein
VVAQDAKNGCNSHSVEARPHGGAAASLLRPIVGHRLQLLRKVWLGHVVVDCLVHKFEQDFLLCLELLVPNLQKRAHVVRQLLLVLKKLVLVDPDPVVDGSFGAAVGFQDVWTGR